MKKVVADFIKKEFGCETGYSGSLRILYIKGDRKDDALRAVRERWPNLAFYVRKTEEIPLEAQETAPLVLVPGSLLTAPIPGTLEQDGEGNVFKTDEQGNRKLVSQAVGEYDKAFDAAEKVDDTITEAVLTDVASKDAALELRAKVDEYLIQYQNNKNEKGFYTAAATFLGTNSEYVRDRYRKLKKKGLVESDSLTAQTV